MFCSDNTDSSYFHQCISGWLRRYSDSDHVYDHWVRVLGRRPRFLDHDGISVDCYRGSAFVRQILRYLWASIMLLIRNGLLRRRLSYMWSEQ